MFTCLTILLVTAATVVMAVMSVPLLIAIVVVFTLMAFMHSLKAHLEDDDSSRYPGRD